MVIKVPKMKSNPGYSPFPWWPAGSRSDATSCPPGFLNPQAPARSPATGANLPGSFPYGGSGHLFSTQ